MKYGVRLSFPGKSPYLRRQDRTKRIFVRSPGSARILFTTKTRRIAKDFFASSCLRGEIPFGCGWAALCSSVVSFMLSGCGGLRIPQNPGKSFYRVSDRAESIAWEHQTEDTLVI